MRGTLGCLEPTVAAWGRIDQTVGKIDNIPTDSLASTNRAYRQDRSEMAEASSHDDKTTTPAMVIVRPLGCDNPEHPLSKAP